LRAGRGAAVDWLGTRPPCRDIASTLRRDELIQLRRSNFTSAGPLVVQPSIGSDRRPARVGRRELSGHRFERQRLRRKRTVKIRMEWRSTIARPIDDVDFEVILEQVRRTAWAV